MGVGESEIAGVDGDRPDGGSLVEIDLVELGVERSLAAVLRLNRQATLNAISWAMVLALRDALAVVDAEPRVRVVLITGNGKAFSAGGDLHDYLDLQRDADAFPRFVDDLIATFQSLRSLRMPVVALVNGVAVAGGLELLLSCDFAYAAESARIGDGHLNYGQMGGGGVLSLLPRSITPARARELFFTARLLSAHEALEWGLVNRVVADDALLEAGLEFARGVAAKSAVAVQNAKYVMNTGLAQGTGLDDTMRLERERNALYCLTQPDSHEGLRAFAARRQAKANGR